MDDHHAQFIAQITALLASFEGEPLLSRLPKGSWQVNTAFIPPILKIGIIRNNELLLNSDWPIFTDHTIWLENFVPPVARFLSLISGDVPPGVKVTFALKSEDNEWRASCSASALIKAAKTGKIDEFGSMMSMLDIEVEDFNSP